MPRTSETKQWHNEDSWLINKSDDRRPQGYEDSQTTKWHSQASYAPIYC